MEIFFRQLGYPGGHLHMTHGNSSVGDLRAALASGDSAAMEFDCAGEEGTLGACQWRNRSAMGVQTEIHSIMLLDCFVLMKLIDSKWCLWCSCTLMWRVSLAG